MVNGLNLSYTYPGHPEPPLDQESRDWIISTFNLSQLTGSVLEENNIHSDEN